MSETVDPSSSGPEHKPEEGKKFQPHFEKVRWNKIDDYSEDGKSVPWFLGWKRFWLKVEAPTFTRSFNVTEEEVSSRDDDSEEGFEWLEGNDDYWQATEEDKEIIRKYLQRVAFRDTNPVSDHQETVRLIGKAKLRKDSIHLLNLKDYERNEYGGGTERGYREVEVTVRETPKPRVGSVWYAEGISLEVDVPTGTLESLEKAFYAHPNRALHLHTRMLLWEWDVQGRLSSPDLVNAYHLELDGKNSWSKPHFAVLDTITVSPRGGVRLGSSDYERIREEYVARFLRDEPFPEERRSQSQVARLLDSMTLAVRSYCEAAREDSDQFNERLHTAGEMLEELRWSTKPYNWDKDLSKEEQHLESEWVWRHRDLLSVFLGGAESREKVESDLVALRWLAKKYLDQPWYCSTFEHVLVDALVAKEIYAFGVAIKTDSALSQAGNLSGFEKLSVWIAFLVALPIGGIWLAFEKGHENAGLIAGVIWIAVLGVLLLYGVIRWLVGRKTGSSDRLANPRRLLSDMLAAYQVLSGVVMSPRRVREVLDECAAKGAAWPPEIFAILDAALRRN